LEAPVSGCEALIGLEGSSCAIREQNERPAYGVAILPPDHRGRGLSFGRGRRPARARASEP